MKLEKITPSEEYYSDKCPACGAEIEIWPVDGHIRVTYEENKYYHTWIDPEGEFECNCGASWKVEV